VQQHLARVGLGDAGTVGVDGSGLSRDNRTTCHQLEQVLLSAGPGSDLEGSLAVACRTGTLERMLCGTPADGVLHAKTGTLAVSKALSGFLTTAAGHEVSFAFVVNGANAPAIGTAAWSPLVQALSLL
jgi:serine-type D-Ala-D-Ala carboxypeptidase/endopeptidase (penicillin-binding protein 4)